MFQKIGLVLLLGLPFSAAMAQQKSQEPKPTSEIKTKEIKGEPDVAAVPRALAAGSSDTLNLRIGAVSVLIGGLAVDLDFVIDPQWTLGPSLALLKFEEKRRGDLTEDISFEARSIGVRANWFKNGVFTDGLYVGPGLNYYSFEAESSDIDGSLAASASGLAASCLVGYGWFWETFNMMLGAGLSLPTGDTVVEIKDSTGDTVEKRSTGARFALEYTLGWKF